MARKATPKKQNKKQKSFEQTLWDTADKLRGSVESSEYKHVVLSLIFLKFVSDKFEARKRELMAEGKEAYVDMVDFYTMKNVFYLPPASRWSFIQKHAKQDDIAAIGRTYHAWRGEAKDGGYQDVPGFCKAATLEEIKTNDYVLTPGRYVGAAEIADNGVPFEEKMAELTQTLYRQMEESEKLDAVIRGNLEGLGYGG
jgi:type I restriction-modification system DNA methylase subunit